MIFVSLRVGSFFLLLRSIRPRHLCVCVCVCFWKEEAFSGKMEFNEWSGEVVALEIAVDHT